MAKTLGRRETLGDVKTSLTQVKPPAVGTAAFYCFILLNHLTVLLTTLVLFLDVLPVFFHNILLKINCERFRAELPDDMSNIFCRFCFQDDFQQIRLILHQLLDLDGI
jgi:hypothetical protein